MVTSSPSPAADRETDVHDGSVQSIYSHYRHDSKFPKSGNGVSPLPERVSQDGMASRGDMLEMTDSEEQRTRAAGQIQRHYRGHRERRILVGITLDPSTRWVEAVKEARYRSMMQPRPRVSVDDLRTSAGQGGIDGGAGMDGDTRTSVARQKWKKIGLIARRAGWDEESGDTQSDDDMEAPEIEREERRKQRAEAKIRRQKAAKMMDLQYFLEMIDVKHRYGSNLRTYHGEWEKSDTKENFFYWLDYGEGRFVDCMGCPRERLKREQVRYLSKEERLNYLVRIDREGRLCWAKNGAGIDTTQRFKDSIHGIVPDTDNTPAYVPAYGDQATGVLDEPTSSRNSWASEASQDHGNEADDETDSCKKQATRQRHEPTSMKKVRGASASTIFNNMLRGYVHDNTWIFVVDTSFRLYVGIKQSGAFQHSSFLHGSRISAAGEMTASNGQLMTIGPLSGHYRTPVSNFRVFFHSLKDAGVDMSQVKISRSYAVLIGLDVYATSRRRGNKIVNNLIHRREKSSSEMANPGELDDIKGVESQRRSLQLGHRVEEEGRANFRANIKLLTKVRIWPKKLAGKGVPDSEETDEMEKEA